MQASEKEAIKLLRSQIPIGISEAVTLLNTHAFDVILAIADWKKKTIQVFASKTSITEEEANTLLISNEWSEENALQALKEKTLSLTERVLQSSNNCFTILLRIDTLIIKANPFLHQDILLENQESLDRLNFYQGKFYTLWDWITYVNYKGFKSALYVKNIHKIISILYEFDLEEYADAVVNALERKQIFHKKYGDDEDLKEDFSQYLRFRNALGEDPAFAKCDELFRLNREPIYKRLVAFVKAHKDHFPA